jgi:CRP/FNR family transcriptional regulator, cyclic AMP receptor protein
MTYRLHVVPKKKRRRKRGGPIKTTAHRFQFSESRLGRPLVEQRLFGNLPQRVYAGIDAISSAAMYPKGAILFVEGQNPLGVFVLRSGRVKLSVNSADGKSLIVRKGEPGEVVGLPAAISGKPNELTAEALEPLQCNFIPRNPFLQFLRGHGEAALRVAEILSEIYEATLHQVRYLGLSASTAEKLARFLLESPFAQSQNNGHLVQGLPLTHKEIAEMIGSSRETVTRVFARFKRENLVQVHGSGLRIVNRAGLEQLLVG